MGGENISQSKTVKNIFVLDLKWRSSLSEIPLHSHFGGEKKETQKLVGFLFSFVNVSWLLSLKWE